MNILRATLYNIIECVNRKNNKDLIDQVEELFGDANSEEAQNWLFLRGYKPMRLTVDDNGECIRTSGIHYRLHLWEWYDDSETRLSLYCKDGVYSLKESDSGIVSCIFEEDPKTTITRIKRLCMT